MFLTFFLHLSKIFSNLKMILDLQYLLQYWLKSTQFLNLKEKCFQFTLETQRLNESYSYLLKIYQKEFIHSLKNVFVPSKYCESILILTNDNILKHFKTRSKKNMKCTMILFSETLKYFNRKMLQIPMNLLEKSVYSD